MSNSQGVFKQFKTPKTRPAAMTPKHDDGRSGSGDDEVVENSLIDDFSSAARRIGEKIFSEADGDAGIRSRSWSWTKGSE